MAWEPPVPREPTAEPPVPHLAEEEEELEFTPAIRSLLEKSRDIAEEIIKRLMEFREPSGGSGERLWEKIESVVIRGQLGYEEPLPGLAIDSTFPIDGGMELIGGRLVAIVAGYVSFGRLQGRILPRQSFASVRLVDTEEALKTIPYHAKLYEKKLAMKLLKAIENGDADAKIILFDGELVPYALLFKSPESIGKSRILSRLSTIMQKLLEKAREHRITLVGVVKRSYSKLLAVYTGRRLPLNDKAVMSLVLDYGEYAVVGRFGDILPRYAEIIAREKGVDPKKYRSIVSVNLSNCPDCSNIVVAFYKPHTRTPSHQAVRVEVLDFGGYGLERILSMLNKLTNPGTGLPYPIDLVDEYIRLEARVLELVRRKVIGHIAQVLDVVGPGAVMLLGHTNPEKRYIYEPRRRFTVG
ncbi:DNA double-strand break repair nuclease NurA [Hyperthermus butylicus]|uniref:NurA domain-containing protein n=1 Tax=Hyperthermus butylicus (strain DSM 5456 / JCM 9403 / PLM1-5) TaxID=415426 RepID=A2BKD0_HYPBU|nr:DNA double-strand break repair nuclease NurA [Hyperthermus butylicus]ABM80441.1 hypothetical protein Hbut_0581 [Hyperthermus butylicus DSM 5456]